MRKVKIAYGKLKPQLVVDLALNVHTKLTGNAVFPTPPVTLVSLSSQIEATQEAITAAANRDRQLLAALRIQKGVLVGMLRQVAEYVNTTVTDGNEEKLLSSGFELYKTPEKNQPTQGIDKIDALYSTTPQTIELMWSKAKNARYYNVFISPNNGATWTLLNTVFGRKLLVESLTSGTRYQFKVVPVGRMGDGPVSDIASQLAS